MEVVCGFRMAGKLLVLAYFKILIHIFWWQTKGRDRMSDSSFSSKQDIPGTKPRFQSLHSVPWVNQDGRSFMLQTVAATETWKWQFVITLQIVPPLIAFDYSSLSTLMKHLEFTETNALFCYTHRKEHKNTSRSRTYQLVPYDAVNRNKVSIRQLSLFYFSFLLTTCFGPYGPSSGEIYN
jgi:hypothetical protein